MTKTIVVGNKHFVNTGSLQTIAISIDGQNGVDVFQFVPPDLDGAWVWRVETEQNGVKKYHLLDETLLWTIRSGDVEEGNIKIQLVGLHGNGEDTLIWKSRIFDGRVLPSINAGSESTPEEISDFDRIAAEVQANAQAAKDAALRAEQAVITVEVIDGGNADDNNKNHTGGN